MTIRTRTKPLVRADQGVATAIAMAMATACGGGDATSGISTGLPVEQKLSTLSDADVQQACRALNEGSALVVNPDDLKRVACLPYGLQASATQSNGKISVNVSQCQQVVDACVSDADDDAGPVTAGYENNADDCSSASSADLKGCDATVGEYETCFNLLLGEVQRRLGEMTCQNAEMLASQGYDNDLDPASIPQCETLMTQCPDADLGIPGAD